MPPGGFANAAVHSYNFAECAAICADATNIAGADIVERAGTEIDVVVGGAPCQGFSVHNEAGRSPAKVPQSFHSFILGAWGEIEQWTENPRVGNSFPPLTTISNQ